MKILECETWVLDATLRVTLFSLPIACTCFEGGLQNGSCNLFCNATLSESGASKCNGFAEI